MNIDFSSNGLINKNGIWYSKKNVAISYPDNGNDVSYIIENKSFWFKHRNDCIISLLKQNMPKGPFYDVGGGNGYVTKGLQDNGIESVVIEPGEGGCKNAQKRGINNIICSTIEEAGFEKGTMAGIGVFDVVEHLEDDVTFLKSLNSYLQKDGLLCVTVPAYKLLWSIYDTYGGHFHRYTLGSLEGKLKTAGFGILYSSYIFTALPLPMFLMRAIPSKLGLLKESAIIEDETNTHAKENHTFDKIWDWELKRVNALKSIPFGGTCLVLAKKI